MIQNKKILAKFNELKAAWNPADSESLFRLIDFENEIGASEERASVPTLSDLPNLNANEGRLVYVESENKHYYSDGFSWSDDFSTVPETQTVLRAFGYDDSGTFGRNIEDPGTHYNTELVIHPYQWNPTKITLGAYSTFVLDSGVIWCWGQNINGQLGDNSAPSSHRSSPVSVVGGFTDWIDVDAKGYFSVARRADGSLWTWGANWSGQIGDNGPIGSGNHKSSPVSVVGGITDWGDISLGRYTVLATRANGSLWGWGYNSSGEIGDGTSYSRSSPVSVIGGITDWISFGAGYASGGIRSDGTLWTWGYNKSGQLGNNTEGIPLSSPTSVPYDSDWEVLYASGWEWMGWDSFFLAKKTDGSVWGWGHNLYGQLGDGTLENRSSPVSLLGGITDWAKISPAQYNCVAQGSDGYLWGWGKNVGSQATFNPAYGSYITSPTRLTAFGAVDTFYSSYVHTFTRNDINRGFDEFGS